mmetsp:Transcript_545/g.927  ORF Transcript_545/g.927 Transcript_545/m.927 type:complete len:105 (+) Transcript_545:99-413(+)
MNIRSPPLRLYARILRLHRTKYPSHLRSMGDLYVKKEFRDHRNASPEFVKTFMTEWTKYADDMEKSALEGSYGKDLDPELQGSLTDDQKASLERLREEATNFRL